MYVFGLSHLCMLGAVSLAYSIDNTVTVPIHISDFLVLKFGYKADTAMGLITGLSFNHLHCLHICHFGN